MNNIFKFIVSVVGCELAGIVGSIFTAPAIKTWYETIKKPSFNPPNWLFGPVWTILFFLMGVSVFLIWKKGLQFPGTKTAIIIFIIQLIFNILWSIVFFGMKSPMGALVVIVILWIFILMTIIKFFPLSNLAGWLLIPYILWVSFASILNLAIVVLNV
jgi:tryptophan-rich sensory protein